MIRFKRPLLGARLVWRTFAAVLDCGNGYEKEIQKEVNEIHEKRRGVVGEGASTETENAYEVGEAEGHIEDNQCKEEGVGEY